MFNFHQIDNGGPIFLKNLKNEVAGHPWGCWSRDWSHDPLIFRHPLFEKGGFADLSSATDSIYTGLPSWEKVQKF